MNGLGIPVRDTYIPTFNLDDFHSNGDTWNGPRLLRIDWNADAEGATAGARKKYTVPEFQIRGASVQTRSVAYDAYWISVPQRFKDIGRDDPIIHECVHFLQHNTHEEDATYVMAPFKDPTGIQYLRYIAQRVEAEAHMVQIAYILAVQKDRVSASLTGSQLAELQREFDKFVHSRLPVYAVNPIVRCKNAGLI